MTLNCKMCDTLNVKALWEYKGEKGCADCIIEEIYHGEDFVELGPADEEAGR